MTSPSLMGTLPGVRRLYQAMGSHAARSHSPPTRGRLFSEATAILRHSAVNLWHLPFEAISGATFWRRFGPTRAEVSRHTENAGSFFLTSIGIHQKFQLSTHSSLFMISPTTASQFPQILCPMPLAVQTPRLKKFFCLFHLSLLWPDGRWIAIQKCLFCNLLPMWMVWAIAIFTSGSSWFPSSETPAQ
ncbi:hypothetical protein B0H14DRAFT_1433142 [Mycena olivaceomarginata]|nr:hypothetical protein B0H14DRAFT_1433142 [Mycena olivaceomarginata]